MTEPPPIPPANTFVIRFWWEWVPGGKRWRGQIIHVQSGEWAAFLELKDLLDFVQRFGLAADDTRRVGETGGSPKQNH